MIQTVLFPKKIYTKEEAIEKLEAKGLKTEGCDITACGKRYWAFTQKPRNYNAKYKVYVQPNDIVLILEVVDGGGVIEDAVKKFIASPAAKTISAEVLNKLSTGISRSSLSIPSSFSRSYPYSAISQSSTFAAPSSFSGSYPYSAISQSSTFARPSSFPTSYPHSAISQSSTFATPSSFSGISQPTRDYHSRAMKGEKPAYLEEFLKEHGDEPIKKIAVVRTPITKGFIWALDILSSGSFSETAKKLG